MPKNPEFRVSEGMSVLKDATTYCLKLISCVVFALAFKLLLDTSNGEAGIAGLLMFMTLERDNA